MSVYADGSCSGCGAGPGQVCHEICKTVHCELTNDALRSRLAAAEKVANEAASVVQRAGRRPDGTAWADLNINDLASLVAAYRSSVREAKP